MPLSTTYAGELMAAIVDGNVSAAHLYFAMWVKCKETEESQPPILPLEIPITLTSERELCGDGDTEECYFKLGEEIYDFREFKIYADSQNLPKYMDWDGHLERSPRDLVFKFAGNRTIFLGTVLT